MKRYRSTLQVILPIIFFAHLPVYASYYSPYVFKIESDKCLSSDKEKKSQTGFIVKEITGQKNPGIITALHGVVGCDAINARGTEEPFHEMKIIAVDIERDLAFLSYNTPQDLKRLKNFYKKEYKRNLPDTGRTLCVGYPLDIEGQYMMEISVHGIKKLWTLLPQKRDGSSSNNLTTRQSPNTYFPVLSVQGHFVPGHSGAPILNEKNQVIGVLDGGLQKGSGIAWAIPYDNEIEWEELSSKTEEANKKLDHLARLPVPELLSFDVLQKSNGEFLLSGPSKMMNWYEAQQYVKRMNTKGFKGHHDWRIPARGELKEIAQSIKKESNTNKLYWSSEGIVSQAWAVHLGSGEEKKRSKRQDKLSVWLVRNY